MQERSEWDARQKLKRLGASDTEAEQVIQALVVEDFLSETRFLESYIRTHLEHKKWGPAKIANGLISKGFASSRAWEALRKWDQEDFDCVLQALVARRSGELDVDRERVIRFLINKGFSLEAILKCIDAVRTR